MVIASGNGNQYRNGGPMAAVETCVHAHDGAARTCSTPWSTGVNLVELDPKDASVGYGGLPNADGVVQLDSSVMHGPKKRAGAVAALEGVRTPSLVAQVVMEDTDHHLLVGQERSGSRGRWVSRSRTT